VGVAVNTMFFKNLDISSTEEGRTLRVGICNHLKKISRTFFRVFGNSAHKWAWQLMQFYVKTSISLAREEVEP